MLMSVAAVPNPYPSFGVFQSILDVADLSMLRAQIPKLESRYIDNLVGDEKNYFERSPTNFVDRLSCPIILFQGLDDKIVSPEQARTIHKALKEKGFPVGLDEYEGEPHGLRKISNEI